MKNDGVRMIWLESIAQTAAGQVSKLSSSCGRQRHRSIQYAHSVEAASSQSRNEIRRI